MVQEIEKKVFAVVEKGKNRIDQTHRIATVIHGSQRYKRVS